MKSFRFISAAIALGVLTAATLSYAAEPGSSGDPIALKSYVDSKIAALEAKIAGGAQGGRQAGAADATAGGTGSAADAAVLSRIDALEKSIAKLTDENESLRRSIRQTAASLGAVGAAAASPGAAGEAEASPGSGGGYAASPGTGGDYAASPGAGGDKFVALEALADQRIILGAGTEFVLRSGKALAIKGELGALVDLITGKDLDAGAGVPVNHLILSPRDDNRGVRMSEDSWVLIKGYYTLR